MNIKIFVHGVPAGHDIWGKDLNERIYFNKFYNTKFSDKVKFLIEKNNNYCYYNYLIYQNVLGSGDRSGSYFGISLQVNAYCKDILKIYNILDTIYSLYVQGNILEEVNGKLKYKISSFNSVERLLNEIAGEIIELLKQKGLSDNSFMPLNNIEKSNANYAFLNLYEFSSNTIYDYFKKNGIVDLSPYYPTQKENKIQKDCQQQIAIAKNECQEQLAQKDAECKQKIAANENELFSLRSIKKQNENKIEELGGKVRDLEKQIYVKNKYKDIEKELISLRDSKKQNDNKIRELQNKIAEYEEEITSLRESKKQSEIRTKRLVNDLERYESAAVTEVTEVEELKDKESNPKRKPIEYLLHTLRRILLSLAKRFLEIIIIILLVIILFKVKNRVEAMEKDIKSIKENTEQVANNNNTNEQNEILPEMNAINYSNLSIDIESYSNGYLEKGKQYICTIKDFPQNADKNNIKIKGDNCKIIPTDDKLKFKIEPKKDKEQITLKILVEDKEVYKRQIPNKNDK